MPISKSKSNYSEYKSEIFYTTFPMNTVIYVETTMLGHYVEAPIPIKTLPYGHMLKLTHINSSLSLRFILKGEELTLLHKMVHDLKERSNSQNF